MSIKLHILLMLLVSSIQSCQKGCLRCNNQKGCDVCDTVNFYVLKNKICEKITSENCLEISSAGVCLRCHREFFLDSTQKLCLPIQIDKKVDNCTSYSSTQTCRICDKTFFLQNGKCLPIEVIILGCEIYDSGNTCGKCDNNYFLNRLKNNCALISADQYCQVFSQIQCKQCKSGFILNYNLFSDKIFDYYNSSSISNFMNQSNFDENPQTTGKQQVCQQITTTNCLKSSSAVTCEKCKEGYFLDDKLQCQENPIPKIDFCKIYEQNYTCRECENLFYLSGNQCKSVTIIEECKNYDGSSSFSECKECNEGFVLQGQTCQQRKKTITNCLDYKSNDETCLLCQSGFVASTDNAKCIPSIPQCETHAPVSSSQESTTCLQCKDGYFLQQFRCVLGVISNCLQYVSQDICKKCENQFYLNNGKCTKSRNIENCLTYKQDVSNSCKTCDSNHFNFLLKNTCHSTQKVANCTKYNASGCAECSNGFELIMNACSQISTPNCVKKENGKCIACAKDFALDYKLITDPQCSKLPSAITLNCEQTSLNKEENTEAILDAVCQQCKVNTIPLDQREQFMCIENSLLYVYRISTDKLVPGCVKYDQQGFCAGCQQGLFLSSSKTCKNVCLGTIFPILVSMTSNLSFVTQYINYCEDDGISLEHPCAVAGPNYLQTLSSDSGNTEKYVCLKCKPEFLEIVQLKRELNGNQRPGFSLVNPLKLLPPYIESPLAKFSSLNCFSLKSSSSFTINDSSSRQLVPNCEYYFQIGDIPQDFGCLKCKHNYVGTSSNKGYIFDCAPMNDCKKDFYHGIDIEWQSLFSCHICQDQNKIPFLHMVTEDNSVPKPFTFFPYQLKSIPWLVNGDANAKNISCLEPKKTSFGYKDNQLFVFPQNCGLGFMNLLYTQGENGNSVIENQNENISELAIFCVACKPGYSAKSINQIYYPEIKVECSPIENCQVGSEWFNSCSRCQSGFTYQWSQDKINYDKCIPSKDPNCFAMTTFGSLQICQACKKGFSLNYDFVCEKFIPPHCDVSIDFIEKGKYQAHPFFSYYHNQEGLGCAMCESGFTAVEISSLSQSYFICTNSSYVGSSLQVQNQNSNYIDKCQNYSIENNIPTCAKCQSGYLMMNDSNKKKCIIAPANCILLDNTGKCSKCNTGYGLVQSQCQIGQIPFCVSYNTEENNTLQVICKKCDKNFYLTINNNCAQSQVANCLETFFNIPNKCKQCAEEHVLVNKANTDYCFPLPDQLSCKEGVIQEDLQYGATLECKQCKNGSSPIPFDGDSQLNKTQCLAFHLIENCLKYDVEKSFNETNFNCTECQQGFYMDQNGTRCMERKYLNDSCEKYEVSLDECSVCSENSLRDVRGYCVSMPNGIMGCQVYDSGLNCVKCQRNRYLEGNICLQVEQGLLKPNCVYYESNSTCKECDPGFHLANNLCLKVSAQNCLTYSDVNTCASCNEGFRIQDNSLGVRSCMKINKSNCIEISSMGDYFCTKCQRNYFPNDVGECTSQTTPISNCLYYASQSNCQECNAGFILAQNKKECVNQSAFSVEFDQECSIQVNHPNCIMCKEGAYFLNDQCVLCPGNESCFRCNQTQPFLCELCKSGFYMDENKNCLRTNPVIEPEQFSSLDSQVLSLSLLLVLFN